MDISNKQILKDHIHGLQLKKERLDSPERHIAFFHSPGGRFRLYGQMCCSKGCPKFTYIGQLCHDHGIEVANLEVKESTIENAGMGLFAHKIGAAKGDIVFKNGDLVSYYIGLKLDIRSRIKLYGTNYKNKCNNVYTSYYASKTIALDSALKRCFVSYGNSPNSTDSCNSELVLCNIGPTLSLIAIDDIRHGDEIFYYYGTRFSRTQISYNTNNSRDSYSTVRIMEF